MHRCSRCQKVVTELQACMSWCVPCRILNVMQRNKGAAAPVALQQESPVSAWCCVNKGAIHSDLKTATNSFTPGTDQEVPLTVQVCVAHSTVRGKYVQCCLLHGCRAITQCALESCQKPCCCCCRFTTGRQLTSSVWMRG